MQEELAKVIGECEKVIAGKRDVIEKLLMAILAGGHVLLDDVPGVGKTTLAVVLSKSLGLEYRRIQFTPDVLPSDIVGFSMYDKETGGFSYMPGVVTYTNILLGDEINRTSSKTQSALLEAMEENQVTVDGITHALKKPFVVIATQNNVGSAGTQLLPFAQLDRFLIRISMGYPDFESQKAIISGTVGAVALDRVMTVSDPLRILNMQRDSNHMDMNDAIVTYIANLAEASRSHADIELGISPRGALAIGRMAKAHAFLYGRDYVIPEDVQTVFKDVCVHRIILSQKARIRKVTEEEALAQILKSVNVPDLAVRS